MFGLSREERENKKIKRIALIWAQTNLTDKAINAMHPDTKGCIKNAAVTDAKNAQDPEYKGQYGSTVKWLVYNIPNDPAPGQVI